MATFLAHQEEQSENVVGIFSFESIFATATFIYYTSKFPISDWDVPPCSNATLAV